MGWGGSSYNVPAQVDTGGNTFAAMSAPTVPLENIWFGPTGSFPPITTRLDFSSVPANSSGAGWSWVQSSRTLTLNGLNLTVSDEWEAIILPGGSTIILNGTNSVKNTRSNGLGIECKGNLTIQGSGSLNVEAQGTGIYLDSAGNFIFRSGILNISVAGSSFSAINTNGNITINGGTGTLIGGSGGNAVRADGTLSISGVTVMGWGGSSYNIPAQVHNMGSWWSIVATSDTSTALTNVQFAPTGGSSSSGGGGGGAIGNASLSSTTATFDKSDVKDITVTLNRGVHTLSSIMHGSRTLADGTDYTISGNTVTLRASWLGTLATGNQTITFNMSGGTSPTFTITVRDAVAVPTGFEPMKPTRAAGTVVSAIKTNNPLLLNGDEVDFPAVNIDNWNWLKLRDMAMLLNGTSKQFSIGYDRATNTIRITTGSGYTPIGDELEDMLEGNPRAVASPQSVVFNGRAVEVAAYNIEGYNYFRLRDLMILLDIFVAYDEETGVITLDLTKPYTE